MIKSLSKNNLFPIYLVIFLDNFGFSIVFTLFGPLILRPEFGLISAEVSMGVRNFLLALLFGIFPLTQFFGAPLLGDFADHFGRKTALYISIVGTTAGYFLSAVGIVIHSYLFILISRFLTGFFAGNLSICLAVIADNSPDETIRSKNFGFVTMLFGVSWILAMLVGGYLSDPHIASFFDPSLPFWLTGVISLLSLWAMGALFHETRETGEHFHLDLWGGCKHIIEAVKIRSVRAYYVIYFLWTIGWGMTIQWFSALSIEKYSASTLLITWWLIALGITWSLGGSYVNKLLLKKYTSMKITLMGLIWITFLIVISTLITNYTAFSIIYCIGALFSAFTMANVLNLISINAPSAVQGKIMGLSSSTSAFAWIASAVIAGFLGSYDVRWLYPIAALTLVIALIVMLVKSFERNSQA